MKSQNILLSMDNMKLNSTNKNSSRKVHVPFQFWIVILILVFALSNSVAGEISCRYYSNHNDQENLSIASDIVGGIADLFTGGVATSVSRGASAIGIGSQLNDHKIYCTYSEINNNQSDSNRIFFDLVKNGDIIPVFLYENIAQKKVEPCTITDIDTPFSSKEKRDKSAKENEFVFGSKTAISDIKYFGFIQPKSNHIIMYAVNPKTLQLREPTYKQWKEINNEYLK